MTSARPRKFPFREMERAADAFCDGLGNVIRLGGLLGPRVLGRSRLPDRREGDTTHDKKSGDTKKSHSILRDSEKGYLSHRGKSNKQALSSGGSEGVEF
jgi:hypothetical protein